MKKLKILVCLAGAIGLGGVAAEENTERKAEGRAPAETSQLRIGEEGVVWYATWELALAEAKRSQKPIFFMSAACQRGTVSGVF